MLYRLTTDHRPHAHRPVTPAGTLFMRLVETGVVSEGMTRCFNTAGSVHTIPTDLLDMKPTIMATDFPAVIDFIARGMPLPNFRAMDPFTGINHITAGGSYVSHGSVCHLMPPDEERPIWGRMFVSYTQGRQLDGAGLVLLYRRNQDADLPQVGRFHICSHTPVVGGNANPMRGYHPARCSTCGLDLSVDSGD